MMERLFLLPVRVFLAFAVLLLSVNVLAQPGADSLVRRDTLPPADTLLRVDTARVDTAVALPAVPKDTIKPFLQHAFSSDSFLYRPRLFYKFTDPIRYTVSEKTWEGKEVVFYSVIALLLLFAFIRNSFARYTSDLFSSYFRTTVRQRQVKEQLLQSPLPSLLFNFFFTLSAGVFISLLLDYFGQGRQLPFWLLVLYCTLGVAVIYAGKFLLLKFFGWVFQQADATDTYIFVVFSTNKVLGIFLLPFTILLAFTYGTVSSVAVTLAIVVIVALFLYRFFLSYISINRSVDINIFHFLLYLAAFEVIPLLLINKLLFSILREIS